MSSFSRDGLRVRFLEILTSKPLDHDTPRRLCETCVAVLPVRRAAITLDSSDGIREFLSASDEVAEKMEWVQITLGEGPVMDAGSVGPAVLYNPAQPRSQWPLFAREAESAGIGTLYAFPLQLGTIHIGVLSLYADPGQHFGASDFGDAIAIADLVTSILLSTTTITASIDPDHPWWGEPTSGREVHQATGMIVAQLNVDAREAYVRLRAYAFSRGALLTDVARAVVHEGLRIDGDQEPSR